MRWRWAAAGPQRHWATLVGDRVVRRVLRNSGWLLGAAVLTGLSGLAQGVLLTHALGVRLYGAFVVITTFVTVVNRVMSFRMNEFVVKYVNDAVGSRDRAGAAAAVKLAMIVEASASLLAFLAVVALAPLAGRWLVREPGGSGLVMRYGLIVLAMLVSESSAGVLQAFGRFRLQAVLSVAGAAPVLLATATAYVLGGGLGAMLWATLVGGFVSSAAVLVAAMRTATARCGPGWWRAPLGTVRGGWRPALRFAFSTNASATVSLINRDADVLWLGFFRSATEVGYYRLALSLATYIMMPVSQLAQPLYTEAAAHAAQGDWAALRRLLRRGTALASAYVVPAALAATLAGATLIRVVYGPAFTPAAAALAILVVGMGFASALFWSRPALLALGRADFPLKVGLALAAVKTGLVFLVIPAYGYVGNAALLTGLYLAGVSLSAGKVWAEVARRLPAGRHASSWA